MVNPCLRDLLACLNNLLSTKIALYGQSHFSQSTPTRTRKLALRKQNRSFYERMF